ncbi:MAG: sigma-54 dependent transcriptional regulator [bacterium]
MLKNAKILIADDDANLCYLLKEELVSEGFLVDIVYDGKDAIDKIKNKIYDLLLLDLEMREITGEEVLSYVKDNISSLMVIVLTAKVEIRTAIECIKLGAYDFISKPYEFEQLLVIIKRALELKSIVKKNALLETRFSQAIPNNIIGESAVMKEVTKLAQLAANSDSNILLEGETGTGKELFAEFIHNNSPLKDEAYVTVNCASLPDQLIESELFGYEKGAFTDAKASKQGLVEIANGGTLFFDEIGELSLLLQPKLLRFLENGEFRRIGGVANLKSKVRVIGATNKNLMEEAERKNFRRDLLFRMNVITLRIPPLRERGKDILLLANYFLSKKSPIRSPKILSPESEKALMSYNYPGNVRELEHIIERAIIFSQDNEIKPKDLSIPIEMKQYSFVKAESGEPISMEELEMLHIKKALEYHNWNREETARTLDISQKTLYTKIRKYNLR